MADTETLAPHGIIIPGLDEMHAEAIPGQLKRMARSFELGIVGYAKDEVERNSRFGASPAGILVSSSNTAGDQFLWRKTGTSATSWVTVWRSARAGSNVIVPTADWTVISNDVFLTGTGVGTFYLSVEYNGANVGVNSTTGDLSNLVIGTCPAPWRPRNTAALQSATRGMIVAGWMTPEGNVALNAVVPIRGLLNGDIIQLVGTITEVM